MPLFTYLAMFIGTVVGSELQNTRQEKEGKKIYPPFRCPEKLSGAGSAMWQGSNSALCPYSLPSAKLLTQGLHTWMVNLGSSAWCHALLHNLGVLGILCACVSLRSVTLAMPIKTLFCMAGKRIPCESNLPGLTSLLPLMYCRTGPLTFLWPQVHL